MNKKIFLTLIFFFFINTISYSFELNGNFVQGGLIKGKVHPGTKVLLDNKPLKVSKEGFFVFGISKERLSDVKLEFQYNSKKNIVLKEIKKRKFVIQRIDGLPPRMVTPNEKDMLRIKAETKLINTAKLIDSNNIFFYTNFAKPVEGIITGKYGNQRILNGEPRRAHYGIDIAAKKGTPVKSPANGVVTLVEKNLYFTGGTIFIDHGHGINSIYSHLETVNVQKGQSVLKGDVIATVGSTGRSTGPHLDFRIYWKDVAVDPELVLKN
jgi:murein DD-endopeptidase MepM/ murein hydrolase activator NlpD